MSVTTHIGAWNEMCARLRLVVADEPMVELVGYEPEIRYVDKKYAKAVSGDKLWLRISLAEAGEKKRTLSARSRVTYQGMVDIQVFTPVSDQRAAERGISVAQLIQAAFTKPTASVDFFGAMLRSMPQEDQWFYKRVNATYNYDVREG